LAMPGSPPPRSTSTPCPMRTSLRWTPSSRSGAAAR
jgi:hypothetical protein